MVKAGSGTGTVTMTGSQPVTASLKFAYPNGQSQVSQATFAMVGSQLDAVYADTGTFVKGLPPALATGKTWARVEPNETDVVSRAVREIGGAATRPKGRPLGVPGWPGGRRRAAGRTTRYAVTAASGQAAGPVPLDLSVDDQDRPTRMTVTLAGQTVTVVYRDWGAPVKVTVPSADEVGALSLPTGSTRRLTPAPSGPYSGRRPLTAGRLPPWSPGRQTEGPHRVRRPAQATNRLAYPDSSG